MLEYIPLVEVKVSFRERELECVSRKVVFIQYQRAKKTFFFREIKEGYKEDKETYIFLKNSDK